jgi:alkanesulfonate monooxygenase SsuD/methylene tetrahydromethanopterin reductase-like flavin-dependent oxidoreductase (luciferase family)
VGATVSTLLALLLTEPSRAHVDVRPQLVELGVVTELRVELPRLRAGAPPERLDVEGEAVETLSTSLLGTTGGETLWSVRLRVDPAAPPGELLLVLRAFFEGGASVDVDAAVTVVPPPEKPGDPFPWLAAGAGAALALAAAAAALVLARRRK